MLFLLVPEEGSFCLECERIDGVRKYEKSRDEYFSYIVTYKSCRYYFDQGQQRHSGYESKGFHPEQYFVCMRTNNQEHLWDTTT